MVREGEGVLLLVSHSEGRQRLTLSDGTENAVDGSSVAPVFRLANWTLVAERWEAPANISDAPVIAAKRNTTHELGELAPWNRIPGLTNASGVGYYTATFDMSPTP